MNYILRDYLHSRWYRQWKGKFCWEDLIPITFVAFVWIFVTYLIASL